jgi:WD40 repeat protein
VTLWSVDRELKSERTVKVHDGGVTSMIVSADSRRLITGGRDGKIVVLDLEFHQPMRTLLGHTRAVSALAVAPDGEHLASGDVGNTVIYWDLKQDWAIAAIDDTKEVNAIVLSGSGRRLATIPRSGSLPNSRFEDGTRISINNVGPAGMVSDGQRTLAIRSSARERFSVQSFLRRSYPQLTLDYDGDTVAVVDGQNVLLYPRDDGAPPRTLQGGRDVTCLALDPKGHALAMGLEEATGPTGPTTRVRVVTTGSEPQPVYESVVDAYAAACAFSPTGNQVAFSLGSRGVKVVSLGSPQTSHDLPMAVQSSAPTPSEYLPFLRRAQRGIAFSANGMMLAATGVDNSVFVWNTSTWQLIGSPLSQLSTTGMSVAFSGDSKILAAGSVDGSVALWTVGQRSDWLPLGRFDSSRSTARVAGFTLDNRSLIVGFDRGIATFDLDTQGWLRKACRIANRDLTKDEWSALFPGEPESTCRKALK